MKNILMSSLTSGEDSSLQIYRSPVRLKLIESIRQIQHDPTELKPVIERAIDEALVDVIKRKNHPKFGELPEFWVGKIHTLAFLYIKGVVTQDKKLENLRDRINSYKSVFVVGAGISFEVGIPFTSHLKDILKFLRCDDYNQLRFDDQRCLGFKEKFKEVCDDKRTSISHRLLSQNLGKKIRDIVCLNWDDLIERAAQEYGYQIKILSEDTQNPVSGGCLWKCHGDIRNIKINNVKGSGGWVFPDEGGFVFDCFLRYLADDKGLGNSLFVIIIVGYSGNDKRVNKVIKTLEDNKRRLTYRVGLNLRLLKNENYIVGPSDYILPKILT